jgi:hypothetical protein
MKGGVLHSSREAVALEDHARYGRPNGKRGAPAMARVDALVDGVYRICTTVQLPDTDFQFNQFLIDDERPALIHTGMYGLYGVSVTESLRCSIPASSST